MFKNIPTDRNLGIKYKISVFFMMNCGDKMYFKLQVTKNTTLQYVTFIKQSVAHSCTKVHYSSPRGRTSLLHDVTIRLISNITYTAMFTFKQAE